MMKKFGMTMILGLALLLTACGQKEETAPAEPEANAPAMVIAEDIKADTEDAASVDTQSVEDESPAAEAASSDDAQSSTNGGVIYDENDVCIEYVGTSVDEYGANYYINLTVANHTDHTIYITDNDYTFMVDGCQVNGKFSGQNVDAAGTGEIAIEVSGSALEDEVGAESIDECSEASIGIMIENADTSEVIDTPMLSMSL